MNKLLLIEDYPVIQDMYGTVLRQEGFEVDVVNDGKAALEKVAQSHYDLVLLDMLLPETNGIEFLKQFKERGDTKIVALSDFDYKDTVKEAFALGVSKYWIKVENTPHVLAAKLKAFLNGEDPDLMVFDESSGATGEPSAATGSSSEAAAELPLPEATSGNQTGSEEQDS